MADTDKLQGFTPAAPPSIPGGEKLYFFDADKRVAISIKSIIEVMKLLEARIAAGGL
jgi:hypothetical protein